MYRDPGDPDSNPALGKQWSRDYPFDVRVPTTTVLTFATKKLSTGAKWTKGGCSFLLSFDRDVMPKTAFGGPGNEPDSEEFHVQIERCHCPFKAVQFKLETRL